MRRILLATALLAGTALAGLPADAKTFRWANDGDVNSMDPYTRQETFLLSFMANIYEPLVRRDRDLELEPALAEKWEQTSPTSWRFTLRQGVKFSDGTPFTADDVLFSVERVRAKGSNLQSVIASVAEVRKIDDHTVDFITKAPDPILPQGLTNWAMMSKAWAEKNNATTPADLTSREENFATRNAMGTGPFKLVSREPDRRTVLEPNAGWWDKPQHNLTRVELNIIANDATRVAALLSGEVDMLYTVPPQDVERIRRAQNTQILQGPELRTIYLGLDQMRDELLKSDVKGKNPFKDVRVRKAFYHAIDIEAIKSRVMRGQSRPTGQIFGPGVNGFEEANDTRYKYDPETARKLLAEAGYPNGFSVTLDCPNDRYVNDEAICTAVVSMLARAGVKVTLNAQTRARYFAEINPPGYNTSFYMLGWTPTTYDAHNAFFNLAGTRDGTRGVFNNGGFSNAALDKLIQDMSVESDETKRNAMITEASKIIHDEALYIPLHQQQVIWATRSNIELVQPADNYFPLRYVQVK